jgi:hypothetical protein
MLYLKVLIGALLKLVKMEGMVVVTSYFMQRARGSGHYTPKTVHIHISHLAIKFTTLFIARRSLADYVQQV